MNPIWNLGRGTEAHYPQLQGDQQADAVIVGAGVTGLTTALKLAEKGKRVIVLEAHEVAAGSTGRSTGNLYTTLSQHLAQVRKKHDKAVVKAIVDARGGAINWMEDAVKRYAIDCDFHRRPMYMCVRQSNEQLEQSLSEELEASIEAGIAARRVEQVPELPLSVNAAICLEDQAQYNPLRYCVGLARAVTEKGGEVFERSKVIDIDAGSGTVTTAAGKVRASAVVLATHTPKGINMLQAEMEPYQEYGVSAELKQGEYPQGAFWLRDDSLSLRSYEHGGKQYLVAIGSKHKTGHSEEGSRYYDKLKEYVSAHFDVARFEHQWSAQQYKPADLLPYIGRSGHQNVFVGTGYAADGLTWGTVAADIISRQILGESDIVNAELFNPRRFTPVKSAKEWIKENADVAKNLVQGHLSSSEHDSLAQVPAGQGRVVEVNGEKVAAYRDSANQLTVVSAECPHMKCLVSWNGADSTWDCPCHGSRFTTSGELIEGPAYDNLAVRTYQP